MSVRPDVFVFKSGARRAGAKNKAGQGVQSLGFAEERGIVNREIANKCESPVLTVADGSNDVCKVGVSFLECEKILSPKAKSVIAEALKSGMHDHRKGRLEPPFMTPSKNPADYSVVCLLAPLSVPPPLTLLSGVRFATTLVSTWCSVPDVGLASV